MPWRDSALQGPTAGERTRGGLCGSREWDLASGECP